ncbi:hypothetical protein, partial [Ligilactobacillus saerimneri]|uniref:hypothetical protein n=1 Tax=Ligilactobacillus saerimneri TaxID=228229 RepID=UPI00242FF103
RTFRRAEPSKRRILSLLPPRMFTLSLQRLPRYKISYALATRFRLIAATLKPAHQLARLLALRSGFPLALTGAFSAA